MGEQRGPSAGVKVRSTGEQGGPSVGVKVFMKKKLGMGRPQVRQKLPIRRPQVPQTKERRFHSN